MFSDAGYIKLVLFASIFSSLVFFVVCVIGVCSEGKEALDVICVLLMFQLFFLLSISYATLTTVYIIELSKKGMNIKKCFKRTLQIEYNDLAFVTKVFDYKSPYVKKKNLVRYYIVLSKNEIHEYYKDRAFGLVLSPELIKLEFTKEKYDILYNILPEHQRNQLVEQFSDLVEKK